MAPLPGEAPRAVSGGPGRPTRGGESPGGRQEVAAWLVTADSGSLWGSGCPLEGRPLLVLQLSLRGHRTQHLAPCVEKRAGRKGSWGSLSDETVWEVHCSPADRNHAVPD